MASETHNPRSKAWLLYISLTNTIYPIITHTWLATIMPSTIHNLYCFSHNNHYFEDFRYFPPIVHHHHHQHRNQFHSILLDWVSYWHSRIDTNSTVALSSSSLSNTCIYLKVSIRTGDRFPRTVNSSWHPQKESLETLHLPSIEMKLPPTSIHAIDLYNWWYITRFYTKLAWEIIRMRRIESDGT